MNYLSLLNCAARLDAAPSVPEEERGAARRWMAAHLGPTFLCEFEWWRRRGPSCKGGENGNSFKTTTTSLYYERSSVYISLFA